MHTYTSKDDETGTKIIINVNYDWSGDAEVTLIRQEGGLFTININGESLISGKIPLIHITKLTTREWCMAVALAVSVSMANKIIAFVEEL